MRSAERGRAGGGVAHLRSAERVCGDSSPMRPPLRSVRMGFLKNSASPMRRRLGVAMWGSVRQRVGDSERLGVGDSERLGVGESVGHGDVRVRESARRERVGESRRRVGNALFSVTPLTRSVSGECVGYGGCPCLCASEMRYYGSGAVVRRADPFSVNPGQCVRG